MQLLEKFKEMCLLSGLSGHEEHMSRYLQDALAGYADSATVDQNGNVIATIKGTDADAPRVMVFAHIDQLGFVVRKIEADGFIRLERLGGIPEKVLPGLTVLITTESGCEVPGVIGVKAHHATPAEEKYVVTPYGQLYVDIGAGSADDVRRLGIEIGCPVVYEPRFTILTGGRVCGTSIDDRGGCAVLIALAEQLKQNRPQATVYLVGSVQEEFNLRGAMLAAAALRPDIALSLDVMIAGDTPDLKDRLEVRLGGGPIMGMYSFHGRGTLNGLIPHPALTRLVRTVAEAGGLPLQRSAMIGILTDSSYVQLVGTGIPCIDLGFPARYTHTPVETCQLSDMQGLVDLTKAVICALGPGFDLSRV